MAKTPFPRETVPSATLFPETPFPRETVPKATLFPDTPIPRPLPPQAGEGETVVLSPTAPRPGWGSNSLPPLAGEGAGMGVFGPTTGVEA